MALCRLCEEDRELVESHIVPKFVFRWLRNSSQTGVRQSSQPNRRVQDGWKRPFLCSPCEGILNRYETPFAGRVFVPYHKQDPRDRAATFSYGEWCLPFCVSVSWRVLKAMTEDNVIQGLSDQQRELVASALGAWRDVLLERKAHPGRHEQYMYPVGLMANTPNVDLSSAQNRYFLRTIQIDVLVGTKDLVVFSKLGRLLIIGFVAPSDPEWRGWRIHVRKGILPVQGFGMPWPMMTFLKDSANTYARTYEEMSPRQQRLASSGAARSMADEDEAFIAFQTDVAVFGASARRQGTAGRQVE